MTNQTLDTKPTKEEIPEGYYSQKTWVKSEPTKECKHGNKEEFYDNMPLPKQVDILAKFLMKNFDNEFGAVGGNGEGAVEMAIRLLKRTIPKSKPTKECKHEDHYWGGKSSNCYDTTEFPKPNEMVSILKEADKEFRFLMNDFIGEGGEKEEEWVNKLSYFLHSQIEKSFIAGQEEGLNLRKAYNDPELLNQIKQQTLKQIEEYLDKQKKTEKYVIYGYKQCVEDTKEFINKL